MPGYCTTGASDSAVTKLQVEAHSLSAASSTTLRASGRFWLSSHLTHLHMHDMVWHRGVYCETHAATLYCAVQ